MSEITEFTPATAALGGALIGAAAVLLMATLRRISGISGIVLGSVTGGEAERGWQWAFRAGMVVAAAAVFHLTPLDFTPREGFPLGQLIAGGLLVGFGTGLGSGCTSGHGVCGVAQFSRRSLVATGSFMVMGLLTVWVWRDAIGGGP